MTISKFPLPKFEAPNSHEFINLFDSELFYYLNLLQTDNRYLDNQGLAMDDQEYTGSTNKIALNALYIFPAASKERIDPDDMVKQNKKEELEVLLRLPLVIADNPRVTLLGDPGIGKSTFMQWLTLSLATQGDNAGKDWFNHLLPIVITARKLRKPKGEMSSENFLKAINKSMGTAGALLDESNQTLTHCLTTGQAILLVDGVDEISAETSYWLSSSLKRFFTDYPKVRLILTARVVGFDSQEFWHPKTPKERKEAREEARLEVANESYSKDGYTKLPPDEPVYPHFYLAPFDTGRRDSYVENWTRLYLPKKTQSNVFADTLRQTCQDAHYLDALSRNPVLLTMICFIQWRVGQLPNGRAELYQRIITTYLVALDRARKTEVEFTPDKMDYHFDDIKLWLGKLAWQMQCSELRSMNLETADEDPVYRFEMHDIEIIFGSGRYTTVHQSDLTRFFAAQLAQVICNEEEFIQIEEGDNPDALPEKAIHEAEKLIDFLKKRTGFLIPKGVSQKDENSPAEDFFSFSHLSFQEYFAGYYLSENWSDWAKDTHKLGQLCISTHDNSWIEVWQLAFEESSRKQQSDMLTQLFEQTDIASEATDEQLALLAKVVMNPTIKLKLKDRQKYIRALWEEATTTSQHFFYFFGPTRQQIINTLWKSDFDSLGLLFAHAPQELWLKGIFSSDKLPVVHQLTTLTTLNISDNQIIDLPHFGSLTELRCLYAENAELYNIEHLGTLPKLTLLDLSENPIEDYSPLSKLTQLITLTLNHVENLDCRELAALSKLENLECIGSEIGNCEALGQLTHLKTLNLKYTDLESTQMLAKLVCLEELTLTECRIETLPSLNALTSLRRLDIEENSLNNLSALSALTNLEYLDISHNCITDLQPLSTLTKLRYLDLSGNPINDVSPLVHCKYLEQLHLSEEQKKHLNTDLLTRTIKRLSITTKDDIPF